MAIPSYTRLHTRPDDKQCSRIINVYERSLMELAECDYWWFPIFGISRDRRLRICWLAWNIYIGKAL